MSQRNINPMFVLRNGNTSVADKYMCAYCKKEIPIVNIVTAGGLIIDRRVRVDCQIDDDTIESYHLPCYDLAVFGELRHDTVKRMALYIFYKPYVDTIPAGRTNTK